MQIINFILFYFTEEKGKAKKGGSNQTISGGHRVCFNLVLNFFLALKINYYI